LRVSRTNYYRKAGVQIAKDSADVATLQQAHFAHPFYGTRRLSLHLGWSRKKVRRIRNLAGIVIDPPVKRRRYKGSRADISAPPNILHRYATFKDESRPQDGMDYSNMVNARAWVQDFTYLWFDRHMHYLAVVLDLKTRQVVGWRLGASHSSELTLAAVLDALSKHSPPAILRSDQGSEYLSYKHQELCERMEIQLSASAKASPWQNGYMERWFGGFKKELGNLAQYKDLPQLHEAIALQIHYYNHKRIHSALGMSPAAYAASLNPEASSERVLQKVGP
jgi:transposase InsO family protein